MRIYWALCIQCFCPTDNYSVCRQVSMLLEPSESTAANGQRAPDKKLHILELRHSSFICDYNNVFM